MPLRLLHHRGLLHDTLRLLPSSSFQHKTVSVSGLRALALPRHCSIVAGALGGGVGGHACAWERGNPSEDSKAEFPTTGTLWVPVVLLSIVVEKGLLVKDPEFSAATSVTWRKSRSLH